MSGTLTKKIIRATFNLANAPDAPKDQAQPSFEGTNANQVTLSGLRMGANIVFNGEFLGQMHFRIYGMEPNMMAKLTTLGLTRMQVGANKTGITIEAGDSQNGLSVVFGGTVVQAWADFQSMPNVLFHVMATSGRLNSLEPVSPLSFKGGTNVVDVMTSIAKNMGYTLENNGVEGFISDPYFPGTAIDQARECAFAGHFDWFLDTGGKILAIWPKGQGRKGTIARIATETGMVGYPSYTEVGIRVKTLYNPGIKMGGHIKIESDLKNANGEWEVHSIIHEIEAETPGGQWITTVFGAKIGDRPVK